MQSARAAAAQTPLQSPRDVYKRQDKGRAFAHGFGPLKGKLHCFCVDRRSVVELHAFPDMKSPGQAILAFFVFVAGYVDKAVIFIIIAKQRIINIQQGTDRVVEIHAGIHVQGRHIIGRINRALTGANGGGGSVPAALRRGLSPSGTLRCTAAAAAGKSKSQCRTKAVSYTHLDVYKRQGFPGSSHSSETSRSVRPDKRCPAYLRFPVPVSYTHLPGISGSVQSYRL